MRVRVRVTVRVRVRVSFLPQRRDALGDRELEGQRGGGPLEGRRVGRRREGRREPARAVRLASQARVRVGYA